MYTGMYPGGHAQRNAGGAGAGEEQGFPFFLTGILVYRVPNLTCLTLILILKHISLETPQFFCRF